MSTAARSYLDETEVGHGSGYDGPVSTAGGAPSAERPGRRRAAERSPRPGGEQRREPGWNVLAEDLVAYPPAHRRIFLDPEDSAASQTGARLGYGEAWLEAERARLRQRAATALAPAPDLLAPARLAPALVPEPLAGRPRPATRRPGGDRCDPAGPHHLPPPGSLPRPARDARAVAGRRLGVAGSTAVEPRGLRRLLPGAAALAVLAACWFGVGALAGLHRPSARLLPGAHAVPGGQAYVARPGDTLWSIAAAAVPGGDPRPVVDQLEQELGGQPLVAGDRLVLP